jgi:D-alanine-D-alanine ligase
MKNILILKGGGSSEHEVALRSAEFFQEKIDAKLFNIYSVEIDKEFNWSINGRPCELTFKKELKWDSETIKISAVIPCFHGYPGETGDIQSFLELIKLPYFGCGSEASLISFNKLLTKLMLELAGLTTTPFIQINNTSELELKKAQSFLTTHKTVYLKATNQGSSVGCYKVNQDNQNELLSLMQEAFTFSPYVILEKEITGRELEVSAFEYDGRVHITKAGEIESSGEFYTYEEKYSTTSKSRTIVEALGISESQHIEIESQAREAFKVLKLRHLSRIDFFLSTNGEVFINEVNTFPGHTSISMFPIMMENYGVKYFDYLNQHLQTLAQNS